MNELLIAIILLATGFLFSFEPRRRRIVEMRLQEALASVDQQVADRTDALSEHRCNRAQRQDSDAVD